MMRAALAILLGFSSGVVIAGSIFGFIAFIGVAPRLAQKTRTETKTRFYEDIITLGGVCGALFEIFGPKASVWGGIAGFARSGSGAVIGFAVGVFWGGIAMSLAEMIDVIPVSARRLNVRKGMFFIVLFVALGKFAGSLCYFILPGFFSNLGG
ncbi:MAG: stage V sporulation protein AB [Clostridiales bacterium]|jgi:stage V sporulation protein AB|nr:stage V sporulation protein AB [Clostridiales bacterium]